MNDKREDQAHESDERTTDDEVPPGNDHQPMKGVDEAEEAADEGAAGTEEARTPGQGG